MRVRKMENVKNVEGMLRDASGRKSKNSKTINNEELIVLQVYGVHACLEHVSSRYGMRTTKLGGGITAKARWNI